jgi:glycosyltransferase involved in cell wall biosynthesis
VARNRAAQEAEGDYIAFLDGDDRWRPEYLAAMAEMISRHPGCGAYAAAFDIVSGDRTYPNDSPSEDGPLEDFFCTALSRYVCQPSATVIPREVMTATGGFPAGMKLGEDLWLWIRIASEYPVCFTSRKLVEYNRTASNRSTGIYTPEKTPFSFDELVRPDEGASCRNEYIARSAIYKAITLSAKGDTVYGRRAAETFSYTRRFRRALLRLRLLNVLPVRLRASLNTIYDNLAWRLAKKGF